MNIKRFLQIIIPLFVMVFLYSCEYDFIEPKQPDPIDPTDTISFKTEVAPIFSTQSCTNCHSGTISPDLSPDKAYNSIINNGMIDTDNPDQSIIYTKPSPQGGHPATYTINQAALVLTWIQQGAKNN